MKPVFADAFFYVACLNRADQHHQKAIAFASRWSGRAWSRRASPRFDRVNGHENAVLSGLPVFSLAQLSIKLYK